MSKKDTPSRYHINAGSTSKHVCYTCGSSDCLEFMGGC